MAKTIIGYRAYIIISNVRWYLCPDGGREIYDYNSKPSKNTLFSTRIEVIKRIADINKTNPGSPWEDITFVKVSANVNPAKANPLIGIECTVVSRNITDHTFTIKDPLDELEIQNWDQVLIKKLKQ